MESMAGAEEFQQARRLLAGACRIVVMTGAGVSTESGIPDFRGPNGVWTRDPGAERRFDIHAYLNERQVREQSWRARVDHPGWQAEPNPAHTALVDLERSGKLSSIITQNIDGLHQKAGSDPARVIELHGTMFETVCLNCSDRRDMRHALDQVRAGETDPPCELCGGILKSATISFGQSLDPRVLDKARVEAVFCDLLLVAGSSLTVHPAAGLVGLAVSSGASVVVCNGSETPYDDAAAAVLRGPLGEVLPDLVGGVRPD
ncbi:NAD-dependent protein deacetylase, SIR2 family [Saccharomonospora marina XMU15]|uniref:protein acetyllysine N-acetyltransferase n=1 Tax=Saccharomonospora marina XMU15 TaxID=882083 RepID=H5X0I6_9PSEU|nr:Sir2 family NAD-dependent protein deacetylase [Saccharomonospora marina]EHR49711.1 NAD-dependent protein deacetylase, SIR2 family [Saccharomonospora marina XMU15]